MSLNNLGLAYKSLGQYQRAIDLFEQSLEIKREIGDRHGEADSLCNLALALAKYEPRQFEALTALQQARAIYAELKLDHEVEQCDAEIYAFNQIIPT
jgi:tetratricopeptide (TPR) repeat protein